MNNEMSNIIHFLETHKEDIINRWNDEMMKCPNDPLKGKIQENTNAIFFLFLRMLEEYGNDYSEDIRKIAYKVAAEKIAANIPITEYFNKIAILRTEVINLLEKIDKIDEIGRIRLGSLEPLIITEEFVLRLGKLKRVCNHFHLFFAT